MFNDKNMSFSFELQLLHYLHLRVRQTCHTVRVGPGEAHEKVKSSKRVKRDGAGASRLVLPGSQ